MALGTLHFAASTSLATILLKELAQNPPMSGTVVVRGVRQRVEFSHVLSSGSSRCLHQILRLQS